MTFKRRVKEVMSKGLWMKRVPQRRVRASVLALAAALSLPLHAADMGDTDAQYAAVATLGESNGIALQCKYLDLVREMKQAVVAHAPKERSFGMAFDDATNRAFLAFAHENATCPTHATLAQQVGERIEGVARAFAAQ
ncbi:MAG: hypothetical protein KDJ27_01135 [Gammaproteobacteria bacterium]|nr:hypothetical protein [Gammaproteobacteria bacterium]MCB1922343.1 hypothetical protein [Gammaproteobacteria bacterium]